MNIRKWLAPVVDVHIRSGFKNYMRYRKDWRAYSQMPNAETLQLKDASPQLHDRTPSNPYDPHYFFQGIWATKKIKKSNVSAHVDVGSQAIFVGLLSVITHVTYIDIRPMPLSLDNYESRQGSILDMPYDDNSIPSLSCLHVTEHIGLGRYGDPLDPEGSKKAIQELARVLAPGGNLYFSLPIGKPRVCFNAHRIHSPHQILDYFSDLQLVSFSVSSDKNELLLDANPYDFLNANYACGMFHFTKLSQT
jgi:SAM-dependent methyltransferase